MHCRLLPICTTERLTVLFIIQTICQTLPVLAIITVNLILEDRKGNLWIGTNGGGLDLFNKKTKTFTHFNEETKNSISNNDVYCMSEDKNGNLWIGTNLGLNRMDKKRPVYKLLYERWFAQQYN